MGEGLVLAAKTERERKLRCQSVLHRVDEEGGLGGLLAQLDQGIEEDDLVTLLGPGRATETAVESSADGWTSAGHAARARFTATMAIAWPRPRRLIRSGGFMASSAAASSR